MRIEQLTFTRYLAALTVVFFHYGSHVFPANLAWLNPILTAGPIAVSYFFALSGFIMAVAYYRPGQALATRRYWWARVARIYPVYLLALLLMIGAKWQGQGSDPLTVGLSLAMLQAWLPGYPLTLNAPGWSLSVEAFFYLCFPLLVLLAQRQSRRSLLWGAVVLWLATQLLHTALLNTDAYVPKGWLHDLIYYNPLLHLNTFVLGFLVGVWLVEGRLQALAAPQLNRWGLLGTVLAIFLLLALHPSFMANTGMAIDFTNGWLAPLFLLLIVLLALHQGRLTTWLRLPLLVLLGEASYALYILQRPLHGIYEKLLPTWLVPPDSALHFYLFVVFLTVAAIACYWWFETPLRRMLNKALNPRR